MKRTLLVAAGVLLAGSAYAQSSNVTIYGRMNTSIERQKIGDETSTSMVNNASRIGFKGTEDLGGGLKAGFVLEHGFESDTGAASGTFWGRESTVSIGGNFGTLRLGNSPASEAYFATADYVSMHNHDTGTSSDALYSFVATGRFQNSFTYFSPTFSGFNFALQYGMKEGGVDSPKALAATYGRGPLHLGFGYEEFDGAKSAAFRALYELGALTIGGYYERGSGTNDVNNFRLAAMYAVGVQEFHVNFGKRGETNDIPDTGAKQFTLAYNYNLSKRTKLYTFYTKLSTDVGVDFSSLAVGVRHAF